MPKTRPAAQLIRGGALPAQERGRDWWVREQGVRAYLALPRGKLGVRGSWAIYRTYFGPPGEAVSAMDGRVGEVATALPP
jgi:hypothetical protein